MIVYFIGALQMFVQMFVQVFVMGGGANNDTFGGPVDSTVTVVVLIYVNAFAYLKMGYAAAISFVLFVVIGLITVVNARLLRYEVG